MMHKVRRLAERELLGATAFSTSHYEYGLVTHAGYMLCYRQDIDTRIPRGPHHGRREILVDEQTRN